MSATRPHERASDDKLIGRQLGDYVLKRVLATGGMARIYEAEDRKLGRTAAVKVLEVEKMANDASLTQRFEREAKAVAKLEHDHIITIYQFGEEDGIYFLAMQLIKGRDLAQEFNRLRRAGQRMDVKRGLNILEQVASALDFAHEAGIVHRDVKPSNILLDSHDRATLTDFGLVLQPSLDSTIGTAFGTPRYIAPEQAVASNRAVTQSDIYALAVILYEILTGQTPFNGDSPVEIALSHINDAVPPPRKLNPDIPEAAEREILRALDKDPLKRHMSAGEFIFAVKRAYEPPSDPTPPSSPTSKLNTPTRDEFLDDWDTGEGEPTLTEKVVGGPTPYAPPDKVHTPIPVVPAVAEPVPPDAFEEPTQRRGSPLLPALLIALLLLGGGALLVTNPQMFASLQSAFIVPTTIPASPAPSVVASSPVPAMAVVPTSPPVEPLSEGVPVRLIYYGDTLTLVNTGNAAVDLAALRFVHTTNQRAFSGASLRRAGRLSADDCVRFRIASAGVDLESGCGGEMVEEVELQSTSDLFWKNQPDSTPSTFEVWYTDVRIAACATVSRRVTAASSASCTFTAPLAE